MSKHIKKPQSMDLMLATKMKILRELCIVHDSNKNEVREYLVREIASNPTANTRTTLDRAARRLIMGAVKI